jgi:2-oxoacid:acceptor oxidoreductase gamma subunit (pyruvate/2-ketoisovalerate family)
VTSTRQAVESTPQKGVFEVRFHGRGGQGAVIAAKLLARAAFLEGRWVQSMPFYGSERRGAPVLSFARLDDDPILLRSQVYNPNVVVVLDPTLLDVVDVFQGLREDGMIVINTSRTEEEFPKLGRWDFAMVDATRVALDLGLKGAGMPIVNTAMLGALARATEVVGIDSIVQAIHEVWKGDLADRNSTAARRVYDATVVRRR